jgi:hypothetical protein
MKKNLIPRPINSLVYRKFANLNEGAYFLNVVRYNTIENIANTSNGLTPMDKHKNSNDPCVYFVKKYTIPKLNKLPEKLIKEVRLVR